MIQLSAAEAQERLPELLAQARAGEIVRICADEAIFQLSAVPPRPRPPVTGVPKAGQFKGQFVVPDDFDEPLEELRGYME